MTTHVQAIRRLVVLAMLSLSVFGCGWFGADQPVEKDPNDYLQAESEPDLQVPADLVSRPDLDPFPVPQIPTKRLRTSTCPGGGWRSGSAISSIRRSLAA